MIPSKWELTIIERMILHNYYDDVAYAVPTVRNSSSVRYAQQCRAATPEDVAERNQEYCAGCWQGFHGKRNPRQSSD